MIVLLAYDMYDAREYVRANRSLSGAYVVTPMSLNRLRGLIIDSVYETERACSHYKYGEAISEIKRAIRFTGGGRLRRIV